METSTKVDTEVGIIVASGSAVFAPQFKPVSGEPPSWSGRAAHEMSMDDIESVHDFCMEDAWTVGFEDAVHQVERANPFHRQFLHGVPFSVFLTYYTRGRNAAQRNYEPDAGLFARAV